MKESDYPLLHLITDSDGRISFTPRQYDQESDDGDTIQILDEELDDGRHGFVESANPSLLHLAIRAHRKDADPMKPDTLIHLANALNSRFLLLGRRKDIEEAISLYQFALSSMPPDHPNYLEWVHLLAKAFRARWKQFGMISDLDHSVNLYRDAHRSTPNEHPERAGVLVALAETFICRFDELRQLDDLDSAITLLRMSTDIPDHSHSLWEDGLWALGSSLTTRYILLKAPEDIDEAIDAYQRAKPSYIMFAYPQSLMGHANALLERTQRQQPVPDATQVHKALELLHDALALTPYPNSHRPAVLKLLGQAYRVLFSTSRKSEDITTSIQYARDAIDSLRRNEVKYSYQVNLAESLRVKFEAFGDQTPLTEAIGLCRTALSAVPNGHPEQSSHFSSIGRMLLTQFRRDQTAATLDEALDAFRSAALVPTGLVSDRFASARTWARIADEEGHKSAFDAYRHAIMILQDLSLVGMDAQNRYLQLLAHDTTLASDAAACAIAAGHLQEAVEFLELGRGILWNQSASLRSPLDDLRLSSPDLASQFEAASQELERAAYTSARGSKTEDELGRAVERQRELSRKREDLLVEIRKLPSHQTFLLPIQFSRICQGSSQGPIIMVNGAKTRSDALLIMPQNKLLHVPLPGITLKQLEGVRDFVGGSSDCYWRHFKGGTSKRFAGGTTPSALSVLWHLVVSPVLATLKDAGYGRDTHVWWCSSGAFVGLPLHAAGQYPVGPNCLDEVVSSYTPTIAALMRVRERKPAGSPRLLAVALPDTPEFSALPHTTEEMSRIRAIVPTANRLILEGSDALLETVSGQLLHRPWIHLACHGYQNLERPFESCFHLYDGSLTLEAFMKLQHHLGDDTQADFAFLTACHTASSSSANPDEAVHLASGLQFAGFRSVIGTLWDIADQDGPMVTTKVYEYLFRNVEIRQPDSTEAAEALNRAVKALRDSGAPPRRWAAFIHMGA